MMLELHNVTVGGVHSLSLTLSNGQLAGLTGAKGVGKTALLKAVVGLRAVDGGHICIDGELLTPKSAPYFRRRMAYVPQHLVVPEDYNRVPTGYVELLKKAIATGRPLLVVDEPEEELSAEDQQTVDRLLREAAGRGALVLAVNDRIVENQVRL
jgi:ABC-type cobalamin/Fe3+-siderophores transport system ATPase subunit